MFRDFLLFSIQLTISISPRQFHLGPRFQLTHFTHFPERITKISDALLSTIIHHKQQQSIRGIHARGERGGSVVECRTPEREVLGSKPTAAVLCP